MSILSRRLAPAAVCGLTLLGAASLLAADPAHASKSGLTPRTMPKIFSLIRPQQKEWRHLKIEWLTDVIAARRKAAQEDKPIVVLYTGGAGYNEPLGVC